MKFDVIVGNPPYQNGKNKRLYMKFFPVIETLLKQNGLASIIHPKTPYKNGIESINKYGFSVDKIKDLKQEIFNVGTGSKICISFLSKQKQNSLPIMLDENNRIYLDLQDTIYYNTNDIKEIDREIIKSIYSKGSIFPKKGSGDLISDTNSNHIFNQEKTDLYKYPAYLSSKKDRREVFSKTPAVGYGIKKLCVALILEPGRASRYSEYNENKGVGRYSVYFEVKDEEESKQLQEFFNSKIYKIIDKVKRVGRYAFLEIPINYSSVINLLNKDQVDYIESIKRN